MKKRYFRYSRSSESGKYTEITKDEYLRLKETGQHFFICLEGCFFECCREEYDDYFREMNHAYNTRRDKNGRRITPSSYDKLTDNGRFECMLAKDPTIPSLEQAVEERLYAEWEKHYIQQWKN